MPDVNVLVYAYRKDSPQHVLCKEWLERATQGDEAFALTELVLSGFIRIVTHPKIFNPPSTIDEALAFTTTLLSRNTCTIVRPGVRHWSIFEKLCRAAKTKGNLVADAYHASIAIEHGATWVTTDGDFARFPSLRWAHPSVLK